MFIGRILKSSFRHKKRRRSNGFDFSDSGIHHARTRIRHLERVGCVEVMSYSQRVASIGEFGLL